MKYSFFSKRGLFERYGENPGKMLVHTGVLGWFLSSAAQISAIIFNDKISPEQKSFLIPQEAADGAINILSFYLITSSFKNLASKLVSTGKLTTKAIKSKLLAQGIKEADLGKLDLNIGKLEDIPDGYKSFKNGVDVVASTVGSIISCNIVTPILRNRYASEKQKMALSKMQTTKDKPAYMPRTTMADYQRIASMNTSLKI